MLGKDRSVSGVKQKRGFRDFTHDTPSDDVTTLPVPEDGQLAPHRHVVGWFAADDLFVYRGISTVKILPVPGMLSTCT